MCRPGRLLVRGGVGSKPGIVSVCFWVRRFPVLTILCVGATSLVGCKGVSPRSHQHVNLSHGSPNQKGWVTALWRPRRGVAIVFGRGFSTADIRPALRHAWNKSAALIVSMCRHCRHSASCASCGHLPAMHGALAFDRYVQGGNATTRSQSSSKTSSTRPVICGPGVRDGSRSHDTASWSRRRNSSLTRPDISQATKTRTETTISGIVA